MSWSTELFCNISFNRETFNSIYEVQDRINELNEMIEHVKGYIRNLVMITEPKKFIDEEYDPITYLTNECNTQLNELEDYMIERYKLGLLLENWDKCHNEEGLAIDPPEGITWKTAYLHGDFIKTVKFPDSTIL